PTVGGAPSARESGAGMGLKIPVVAEPGQRVAVSRRIGGKWRLIGYGVLKYGCFRESPTRKGGPGTAVNMFTELRVAIRRNKIRLHRLRGMRVLHRDPKTGEIKLRVENADDLWHLHNLVLPGDLVRASTYRREEVKTDKVRPERGEKVRVTLMIRVEGVEFQPFSDRLRLTGVIVEGPQDLGRHHTLNVAVDDVLSVIKTWRPHELRRIDEAVAAAQKPLVAFLSLDDEEALVAQLRQYGVHELATIHAPGHGKMFPSGDARSVFFDDILTKLRMTPIGEAPVVVGP